MWSYYGTKKRLAKYYPKPDYGLIIEPFCGAAQYSLYGDNWKNHVLLCDKYPIVIDVWKFLINTTKYTIKNLPDLKEGDNIDSFKTLSQSERNLLGFFCNPSSAMPKKTCTKRGEVAWARGKKSIADNLFKIGHWKAVNMIYDNLDNQKATWFIDPPYQHGGIWYHSSCCSNHINYAYLANWCKSRKGQVIVCENSKANWLPFKNLHELSGQLHKTMEVIYTQ